MKLKTAADIMTHPVITVKENVHLTEVIDLLLRWHISGMPVVDDQDRLIGMVTEHDLLNFAFDGNAEEATVADAMSRKVVSFPPETPIEELVSTCVVQRIRRVPIVKDGRVVGIVSRRDVLREMQRMYGRD
ncbi:MAG: CBS domain-containing protein [Verrucomicrobia bacterium]|nr:CBS domain-containing protein [Verrucomicrobiota bacterium]MBU1909029.1 CBS domain-containing protein [Verrucomicrobiota bacterium]